MARREGRICPGVPLRGQLARATGQSERGGWTKQSGAGRGEQKGGFEPIGLDGIANARARVSPPKLKGGTSCGLGFTPSQDDAGKCIASGKTVDSPLGEGGGKADQRRHADSRTYIQPPRWSENCDVAPPMKDHCIRVAAQTAPRAAGSPPQEPSTASGGSGGPVR